MWRFTRKDGTEILLSDFEAELIAPSGVLALDKGERMEKVTGERLSISDRIREELRAEMAPCRSCGHKRFTQAQIARELGQPASSVGRFLAGQKPSVELLEAAETWLQTRAEDIADQVAKALRPSEALHLTVPEARELLG